METFSVETEGLLKEYLVLNRPLIRKRCKIGKVCQSLVNIVLVPEKHTQCLLDEK